ncbi:Crp/Fnr family transcriptional regulator [Agrobacterium sp. CG674]
MSDISQSTVQNLLLRSLPEEAFALLKPDMKRVGLPLRSELVSPDLPIEDVNFLESGLASVVATNSDDESVEVGHVGFEGMSGTHLVLGVESTPNKTFMQVEGSAIAIPAATLLSVIEQLPEAKKIILRYVHCRDMQLSHSALANARYNMSERLARWILMCHDRLRTNDLPLTHEFLSLMLGVRRSGVTNEIHILEGVHAIKATRGNIKILDRQKLEEMASGSYGIPEREYERYIGWSIRWA